MRRIALSCLLLSAVVPAHTETAGARALFQRYQQLAAAYDPAFADLYCDAAVVRTTRRFSDGSERTHLAHDLHVFLGVVPVPVTQARRIEKTELLVIPHGLGRRARSPGQFRNLHVQSSAPRVNIATRGKVKPES